MSQHPEQNVPGPDPEQLARDLAREDEAVRRVRSGTAYWSGKLAWTALITSIIVAGYNTPEMIKQAVKNVVTTPKTKTKEPSGKELLTRARAEAEKIVDEIFTRATEIDANRTVTDETVRAVAKKLLADKKIVPEEAFDLLVNWQEEDLLAMARRIKGLGGPDAADSAALKKRLPAVHRYATLTGAQIRKHPTTEKIWQDATDIFNNPDAKPADIARAGQDLRKFMLDNRPRLHFSADTVVTLSESANFPLTKQAKDRLVNFEASLLGSFIVERHALIGQAKTFKVSLESIDRLAGLHDKAVDDMTKFGFPPEKGPDAKEAVKERKARLRGALNHLGKVLTVMEIRNKSFSDPDIWGEDAKTAVKNYFDEQGYNPPISEVGALLVRDHILALDRVRAELNNNNPDCVEAETIVREIGYAAMQRDNTGGPFNKARKFLERTKDDKAPEVVAARKMLDKLVQDPSLTPEKVDQAYIDFSKEHQDTPFARNLVKTLTAWANKHKDTFQDPESLTNAGVRKNLEKSRRECAKSIIRSMEELLRFKNQRLTWQSGYSILQTSLEPGEQRKNDFVFDPQVGKIENNQRYQSKESITGAQAFLGELAGVHKMSNIKEQRDAAASTVKFIREFISVLDIIRLRGPQTAPRTATMKEIADNFDDRPLRELLASYETHLAMLEDANLGSFDSMAADKKNSNIIDVHKHIAEYKAMPAEQLKAQLGQKLTASQKVALRITIDRAREKAMKPFLTEEMVQLVALADYSDGWSAIVGDMEASQDSWMNLLLFFAGVYLAFESGKWVLRVSSRKRDAAHSARLLYQEWRNSQQTEQVVKDLDTKGQLKDTDLGLEIMKSPEKVTQTIERIVDALNNATLDNLHKDNARPLEKTLSTVKEETTTTKKAADVMQTMNLKLSVLEQVKIRIAAEGKVDDHRHTLAKRLDHLLLDDTPPNARARDAAGGIYQQLEVLDGALSKFTPDLPAVVPALADVDIATADLATVLLVAHDEGLDINRPETELRAALIRERTMRMMPLPPTVKLPEDFHS